MSLFETAITSVDSALNWLRSTFLFVRIQQNPSYYSLAGAEHVSPATRLEQICIESVSNLVAGEIVEEQVDELETRLGPTGLFSRFLATRMKADERLR